MLLTTLGSVGRVGGAVTSSSESSSVASVRDDLVKAAADVGLRRNTQTHPDVVNKKLKVVDGLSVSLSLRSHPILDCLYFLTIVATL